MYITEHVLLTKSAASASVASFVLLRSEHYMHSIMECSGVGHGIVHAAWHVQRLWWCSLGSAKTGIIDERILIEYD